MAYDLHSTLKLDPPVLSILVIKSLSGVTSIKVVFEFLLKYLLLIIFSNGEIPTPDTAKDNWLYFEPNNLLNPPPKECPQNKILILFRLFSLFFILLGVFLF